MQVVGKVKVTVTVAAETPVSVVVVAGPGTTVAVAVLLVLQVPEDASVNVIVKPVHTDGLPVIADGNGFTVITVLILQPAGSV